MKGNRQSELSKYAEAHDRNLTNYMHYCLIRTAALRELYEETGYGGGDKGGGGGHATVRTVTPILVSPPLRP
jgi:8-oxo-dGTP pyrophosphatase MutT (NUDIX family)